MSNMKFRSMEAQGVRYASDSLIDGLEMALDDFSLNVVEEICRQGFSHAFAFAALADARDLICSRVEAEISRREREEIRVNSLRIRGVEHG